MKAHAVKRLRLAILFVCLSLLVAGCSTSSEDPVEPTVEPTTTALPTVSPGGMSVGTLLDQVNAAWGTVQSVQTTFWTTGSDEIDAPPATGEVTAESSIAPDRRHVVRMVDGVTVEEQIAIGGRVFMRGQIVVAAIAPMMGTDAWIEVDPRTATSTASIAAQVNWLLSPIQSPFAAVSDETRSLEAFPGDPVEIDGRTCQTWTFGTADGIQQELALDSSGLPCRLIQRAGDFTNVTLYSINPAGLTIEIPPVATPTAE